MKKILVLIIMCLFLTSCGKQAHDIVIHNIINVAKHDSFLTADDYSKYIKNLDSWAVGEAYDELISLPDNLKEIDYDEVDLGGEDSELDSRSLESEDNDTADTKVDLNIETVNIYACFEDVNLDEFSDFYLFNSEEYLVNIEGGEGEVPSQEWDKKLSEWFNPDKEHDVRKAECFIGYGYYEIIFDGVSYRYYLAVKCNKEGKVEKFINNYLSSD